LEKFASFRGRLYAQSLKRIRIRDKHAFITDSMRKVCQNHFNLRTRFRSADEIFSKIFGFAFELNLRAIVIFSLKTLEKHIYFEFCDMKFLKSFSPPRTYAFRRHRSLRKISPVF
jgi:hypothetical protein